MNGASFLAPLPLAALAAATLWSPAPRAALAAPPPVVALLAQDALEPPAALPPAHTLVRRALEATGEEAVIAEGKARTLRGTIRIRGMDGEGTLRMVQARPDRFLLESTLPGVGTVQVGCDGTTTWMVHPATGPRLLEGIQAAQQRRLNAFDFPLRGRKHVRGMETVARTTFDGRDCYQVRFELVPFVVDGKRLDPEATARYRSFDEYYEVESGLLAGAEVLEATALGDTRSTTIYRDYRELAPDVKVATEIVTRVQEQELVTKVRSIELDPVPATTFAPPDEVKALLPAAEGAGAGTTGGAGSGGNDDAGGDGGAEGEGGQGSGGDRP